MNLLTQIFSIILLTIFTPQFALAANTIDWECFGDFVVPFVSPKEEALQKVANKLIGFRFNRALHTIKYDKDDKLLTITFKKPSNDVKKIGIAYQKVTGGYIYMVIYELKSGALSLLDILNRYGADLIEIKTDTDLSKTIEIKLKNDTFDSLDSHPLNHMTAFLSKDDFISLKFHSANKVFVDTITIGFFKKDMDQK